MKKILLFAMLAATLAEWGQQVRIAQLLTDSSVRYPLLNMIHIERINPYSAALLYLQVVKHSIPLTCFVLIISFA